ncbi:hypothetical protein G6F59_018058 [Rhizopus arrhizus]|nr:hypothetical protein G6F59_018058 [Rhizopus arrhizus]
MKIGTLASVEELCRTRDSLHAYLSTSTASMTVVFCFEAARIDARGLPDLHGRHLGNGLAVVPGQPGLFAAHAGSILLGTQCLQQHDMGLHRLTAIKAGLE